MEYNVALIKGDGIGPEVVDEAVKVLKKVGEVRELNFNFRDILAVGEAIDKVGVPLPVESLEVCKKSDAVIVGNIGGKKWVDSPLDKKPEKAILKLRKELNTSVNLRPIFLHENLTVFSPLKKEIVERGIDILVVRDIVGGMICSEKEVGVGMYGREAADNEYYNEEIIRNVAKQGFEAAIQRRKKLASLDKANALASSALWREVVNEVSKDYPEVEVEHYYVDNASMEVIKEPSKFDVIIASNIFGDIIADEISQITGASGILGSAELSYGGKGIFTPNQLHNEDESIVGKDIANPIGMILSSALMLRYSFGLNEEACIIENAVNKVLNEGYATRDLFTEGENLVGTREMGSLISSYIL